MEDENEIYNCIFLGYYDRDLLSYCKRFELMTLKQASFKAIVNNFSKYNAAYHSSKDKTLRRNLYYLRKNFSTQLLKEVVQGRILNKSYFDFLVNEFLKEIRVGVLADVSEEDVLKRMEEIGSSFERVHFDSLYQLPLARMTPFMNNFIALLPNVEKLLIHTRCDDDTIRVISSTCHRLRTLCINGMSYVSDEGVKMLETLNGTLKRLSLKFTDIEGDGIPFLLEKVSSLEVLVYHQLPNVLYMLHRHHFFNRTLNQMRGYNLTTLDLCHKLLHTVPNVAEMLSICSELCPRLKKLNTLISSERHLDLVSLLSSLETLSIHGTRKEPVNLDYFLKSNGHRLKGLKIDWFAFTPSLLVKCCTNLKSLRIGTNFFRTELNSAEDLKDHQMTCLQHLTIDRFMCRDQLYEACFNLVLDSSPNLESLTFRACEIKDSGVSQKLSLYFPSCKLQSVTFRYTDIEFPFLQTVLDCNFLKTITMKFCVKINPSHIKELYTKLKLKRKYVVIKYDRYLILNPVNTSPGSSEDFSDS